MRKISLFIVVLIVMLGQVKVCAQVTIGSNFNPFEGALLDLKESNKSGVNSTKGLGLPRVRLTTTSTLDNIDTDLNKEKHVGLTIYVPEKFGNNFPGVYVWTGLKWKNLNPISSKTTFKSQEQILKKEDKPINFYSDQKDLVEDMLVFHKEETKY